MVARGNLPWASDVNSKLRKAKVERKTGLHPAQHSRATQCLKVPRCDTEAERGDCQLAQAQVENWVSDMYFLVWPFRVFF